MKKDKFIMPRIVIEQLQGLPDDGFVRILEAICAYEFDGIVPDFCGDDAVVFGWSIAEIAKWNKPKGRRNG